MNTGPRIVSYLVDHSLMMDVAPARSAADDRVGIRDALDASETDVLAGGEHEAGEVLEEDRGAIEDPARRLVQLRHLLNDSVDLAVELLARDDRGAGLGDSDAVFDHEVGERAMRQRGHQRGRAATPREQQHDVRHGRALVIAGARRLGGRGSAVSEIGVSPRDGGFSMGGLQAMALPPHGSALARS
jgi:hypothetical protein